ncbi:hypothetical protein NH8B_3248 [Pseudogulbenkiania sp. NH8B]|uniref:hypothetical protein n=1 Tax=Pseudogulbenkiania sp. (strain NH8B) TaxID=748280 RepID=UPI000227A221|nr:hypothetical protein [Pseudogulbenkiania sp. NH8B]BAK78014.1 hypothetical protein NH8B_3248 [Pseudogulbenkiania sp. NH8B]
MKKRLIYRLTSHGWLGFTGYPLALLLGFKLQPALLYTLGLPLCTTFGLLAWWLNYRRYRVIADTPTSRAGAVAQGYVELFGCARSHERAPLYSSLSGRRCVWFRWERRYIGRDGRLDPAQQQESDASFLLQDGHGEVVVDPEQAEVHPAHRASWHDQDYLCCEEWIADGDPLYVIGELVAIGGDAAADPRRDVAALLAEWKRDQPALLRRFDLDRSGGIDEREWLAARAAAEREVRQRQQEFAATPLTLHLQRPADGRPYLITTLSSHDGARAFRWRAWLHLGAALTGLLLWLRTG